MLIGVFFRIIGRVLFLTIAVTPVNNSNSIILLSLNAHRLRFYNLRLDAGRHDHFMFGMTLECNEVSCLARQDPNFGVHHTVWCAQI